MTSLKINQLRFTSSRHCHWQSNCATSIHTVDESKKVLQYTKSKAINTKLQKRERERDWGKKGDMISPFFFTRQFSCYKTKKKAD